jgi:hypothetical protein
VADPERQHFRLAIGQAKTLVFTLDVAPEGGVAAWTLRFRMRRPGGSVLVEKTTGGGITCTDEDNGEWEAELVAEEETEDLRPGLLDWSLWRTDVPTETPLAIGDCEVYRTADGG